MRIQSPFKDYYDCMLAYDKEPEPFFYRRSTEEYSREASKFWRRSWIQDFSNGNNTRFGLCPFIMFCGEYYPFVQIAVYPDDTFYRCRSRSEVGLAKRHTFYSVESLTRFVKAHNLKFRKNNNAASFDEFVSKLQNCLFDYKNTPEDVLSRAFDPLDRNLSTQENVIAFFRAEIARFSDTDLSNCIYLAVNDSELTQYPRLENYQFGKVRTPQQAFYEIHRVLSNKAQPVRPIPAVSDKTLAEIKGFDKWSFRKEPSKS